MPSAASEILFETVRVALRVAEESGGAFDPTVGRGDRGSCGFNREHRSGEVVDSSAIVCLGGRQFSRRGAGRRETDHHSAAAVDPGPGRGSERPRGGHGGARTAHVQGFRDRRRRRSLPGRLQRGRGTMACRDSASQRRRPDRLTACLRQGTLCTSGEFTSARGERERSTLSTSGAASPGGNPAASATVIAPSAMLADALATAAFVLGPAEGIPFLERLGVEGLLVTPELARHETRGFRNAEG